MSVWIDSTLGTISILHGPGTKVEMANIDVSNDISNSQTMPTSLNQLYGWVGHACFSAGCVSGHQGSPITNMSLCGAYLEISVADATVGIDAANSRLLYQAWGH